VLKARFYLKNKNLLFLRTRFFLKCSFLLSSNAAFYYLPTQLFIFFECFFIFPSSVFQFPSNAVFYFRLLEKGSFLFFPRFLILKEKMAKIWKNIAQNMEKYLKAHANLK